MRNISFTTFQPISKLLFDFNFVKFLSKLQNTNHINYIITVIVKVDI